jgi:NTP-dependent ternary system trypsin peptidase co-occuring protein
MISTRQRALLLAAAVCGAAGCSATVETRAAGGAEGARVEAVIDSVREALNEAQTNNVPGFPPLKSITIKLQTVASRSAGGQIDFLVFALGAKSSAAEASTLELQMEPPPTKSIEPLGPGPNVKEALAQAIQLAKAGVLKASKGKPALVMKNISIDLKFTVEVSGSGGANVTLAPLGIGGTGKISREKVHTVSLVFGS